MYFASGIVEALAKGMSVLRQEDGRAGLQRCRDEVRWDMPATPDLCRWLRLIETSLTPATASVKPSHDVDVQADARTDGRTVGRQRIHRRARGKYWQTTASTHLETLLQWVRQTDGVLNAVYRGDLKAVGAHCTAVAHSCSERGRHLALFTFDGYGRIAS